MIKVISLSRSPERRAAFSKLNAHLRYEFVDAVDGEQLTQEQLHDPARFVHPLRFPSLGAYGNALSHVKLWEQVAEPTTIAEDDAIFRSDFMEQSARVIHALPADWDLVLWGWNFDSVLVADPMPGVSRVAMFFDQESMRAGTQAFQRLTVPPQPLPLDRCFGSIAYTMSAEGARKFRHGCFPLREAEVYFPVLNRKMSIVGLDVAMNRLYPTTRSFAAFPPLVVTKNEHSTVQAKRE